MALPENTLISAGFRQRNLDRRPRRRRLRIKAVAEPAHAHHQHRGVGVGLDFLAQVADMGVDHAIGHKHILAPDLIEQLLPAQDDPPVANERREQLEFNRREIDLLARAAQLETLEIDLEVAETEDVDRFRRRGPAQRCLDPRPQFHRAEWLRDVVVGAKFETENLFGLMALRGEQDDRRAHASVTQFTTDLEAILAGEHHVEQDQIETSGQAAGDGRLAVGDQLQLVALEAQVLLESECDVGIVFDYQNAGHGGYSSMPAISVTGKMRATKSARVMSAPRRHLAPVPRPRRSPAPVT